LSNERFEVYAGSWFVCSESKETWRVKSRESREPALERRWMFYYALGESLRISYRSQSLDLNAALRALSNPGWIKEDEGGPAKKVLGRHYRVAFKGLIDAYEGASKDKPFIHRNWFRAQATLGSISKHIASSWDLISDHGEDYVLPRVR
jgi:hypothetical protein